MPNYCLFDYPTEVHVDMDALQGYAETMTTALLLVATLAIALAWVGITLDTITTH